MSTNKQAKKQVVVGKVQAGREELSGKDISCRESERKRERKIVDDTSSSHNLRTDEARVTLCIVFHWNTERVTVLDA